MKIMQSSQQMQKTFDKIKLLFMIKTLNKVGIKEIQLNILKAIYDKPTDNIISNDEKLKPFPLRSGARKECILALLFNIELEVLTAAIRQQKELKDTQISKEEVKFSLFVDNVIVYIETPKTSTKKPLEMINEFKKVIG